jgi:hypothetical protein
LEKPDAQTTESGATFRRQAIPLGGLLRLCGEPQRLIGVEEEGQDGPVGGFVDAKSNRLAIRQDEFYGVAGLITIDAKGFKPIGDIGTASMMLG